MYTVISALLSSSLDSATSRFESESVYIFLGRNLTAFCDVNYLLYCTAGVTSGGYTRLTLSY